MIYMVKAGDLPYLKIGYSDNFQSRIKHLQNGCPLPIICVAERSGSYLLEYAIHKECRPFLCRNEWFFDCDEVMQAFFSVSDPAPFGLSMKATTARLTKERGEAQKIFGGAQ